MPRISERCKLVTALCLILHSICSFSVGAPDKKFNRWLTQAMDEKKVAGISIAVIRNYKIDWVLGYGVADILSEEKINDSTLFQAGSISKAVTAFAILKSAEDGKIDLDVNVNDILKSWKLPSSPYFQNEFVTLRDILSHSSGINVPGFLGYPRNAQIPSLLQVLNGQSPANSPAIRITGVPGETIQFSGGAFAVAQMAIQDRFQKPFNDIVQKIVFQPLGMTNSSFKEPLPEALLKQIATPYYPKYESVPNAPHTYVATAAAGLWTNPFDLAKFTISIMSSLKGSPYQPLSPESAALMVEPHIDRMGLGFITGVNQYGEPARRGKYFMIQGQNEGYKSLLIARKQGGIGMIIMMNYSEPGREIMTGNASNSWNFIFEIERKIADQEDWY